MAAFREGISTVLIPRDNESDLYEVDAEVKEKIHFIPVSSLSGGAQACAGAPRPHPCPGCPQRAAGNLPSSPTKSPADARKEPAAVM